MRKTLISIIKNNKLLYFFYNIIISNLLKILKFFIKEKENSILFVCYGGRQFGDNIKPIFIEMQNDHRFQDWNFVWAFVDTERFDLSTYKRTKKCRIDSLDFFKYAIKSRCWITNVSIQRGLEFKDKDNFYINTWHGVPVKHIRNDVPSSIFKVKNENFDLLFSASNYDAEIYETAFCTTKDKISISGYPRNDTMFLSYEELKTKIRNKYGIANNKKIILYAPTFRDYEKDKFGNYKFVMPINCDKILKQINKDYILLIRTHGAITVNNYYNEKIIDVSCYENVEDLLCAADILISDYSGIIFDFVLLKKPIICYFYDVEKYSKIRGFYNNPITFFPFSKCYNDEELISCINGMDINKEKEIDEKFIKKTGLKYGNSTINCVNKIYECINTMEKRNES